MDKTKEFIICSAIRYVEYIEKFGFIKIIPLLEYDPEKHYERIVCGRRHNDCYNTIRFLNFMLQIQFNEKTIEDGFMTSKGRFVNRFEAYEIAKKEEQFYMPELSNNELTKSLTSEDLYGVDY